MSSEVKPTRQSEETAFNGNGHAANGQAPGGYQGGAGYSRFITPGGNPIDTSQPAFPVYHRKFANPAPLGLLGFAATTFCLSFYNYGVRGIGEPNVVLGMALGYGGLVQLIAGVEEWACGNTFGATAFASYGGFWFSFAALYIPAFGIASSYEDEGQFASAIGIYLVSWALVTLIFLIAALRSSVALVSLFFMLDLTFWLLAGSEFSGSVGAHKAGGITGIITAFIAMYTALAGMLTKDTSHFLIPVGNLARASK